MRFRRGALGKKLEESFSVRRSQVNYGYQVSVGSDGVPLAFPAIIRLRRDADTVETNFVTQDDLFYVSLTPPLTNIRLDNSVGGFQTQDQVVRWRYMKKAGAVPTRAEIEETVSGVLTILHIEELPKLGRQLLYCRDTTQRIA